MQKTVANRHELREFDFQLTEPAATYCVTEARDRSRADTRTRRDLARW